MKQFIVGNTYEMRSICDHECVWKYKVIKRTEKTITVLSDDGKTKTLRICKDVSEWMNAETVYPLGKYSMSPSLTA